MITVVWMAFLALGAAILHLALVLGSFPVVAVLLAGVGLTELVWAIIALRDRVRMPRLMLGIATGIPLLWAAALTATVMGAPAVILAGAPMLAASALQLALAALLARHLRRAVDPGAPPVAARPAPLLASMLLAGLLVGAVTTPALAETVAGQNARPHGEHLQIDLEPADAEPVDSEPVDAEPVDSAPIDPHSGH